MTVTLIVGCNKLGILLWCTTENIKKLNWTVLTLCGYQGSFKLFNYFFYEKILHTPKAQKSTEKHKKVRKNKDATEQKHKTLQANSKGIVVPLNQ